MAITGQLVPYREDGILGRIVSEMAILRQLRTILLLGSEEARLRASLRPPLKLNPAFGYDAPHLSVRGTLTVLNNVLLSTRFRFADQLNSVAEGLPIPKQDRSHLIFFIYNCANQCVSAPGRS